MLLAIQMMQIATAQSKKSVSAPQAKTLNGTVEGVIESSGVRAFKGIPFAAPPVDQYRWREPQPVKNWQGVRKPINSVRVLCKILFLEIWVSVPTG